ncbi:hypothetical protein FHS42_006835 [Streptomyces zagrosensis]|uniref:Uncharacterized protein n=1 Tax=Streptomyces zagrosensis TaxID=1042984 RepID=A0A7W9QGV6_9ACTN|nr:hypothetical protein [Streptomyces zagrosensis]
MGSAGSAGRWPAHARGRWSALSGGGGLAGVYGGDAACGPAVRPQYECRDGGAGDGQREQGARPGRCLDQLGPEHLRQQLAAALAIAVLARQRSPMRHDQVGSSLDERPHESDTPSAPGSTGQRRFRASTESSRLQCLLQSITTAALQHSPGQARAATTRQQRRPQFPGTPPRSPAPPPPCAG